MKQHYEGSVLVIHRFEKNDIVCSSVPVIETYSGETPHGEVPAVAFGDLG